MLRRTQQRLSCGVNTLALVLVFGVVIVHVLHRRSAANVGPGDDQNVVFWFEAGGLQRREASLHTRMSQNCFVLLDDTNTLLLPQLLNIQATLLPAASLLRAGTALLLHCLFIPQVELWIYCIARRNAVECYASSGTSDRLLGLSPSLHSTLQATAAAPTAARCVSWMNRCLI